MSRWFRFYSDAMRHRKVAKLSDSEFRLWVQLMCIAAENDGKIPPAEDLKFILNKRLDYLLRGLEGLLKASLIKVKGPFNESYELHGWDERQYKSDTSTDRVRKMREKRNVSVTAPDTDTETDNPKPSLNTASEVGEAEIRTGSGSEKNPLDGSNDPKLQNEPSATQRTSEPASHVEPAQRRSNPDQDQQQPVSANPSSTGSHGNRQLTPQEQPQQPNSRSTEKPSPKAQRRPHPDYQAFRVAANWGQSDYPSDLGDMLEKWRNEGIDFDKTVLPTVRAVVDDRLKKGLEPARLAKFFDRAISEAHSEIVGAEAEKARRIADTNFRYQREAEAICDQGLSHVIEVLPLMLDYEQTGDPVPPAIIARVDNAVRKAALPLRHAKANGVDVRERIRAYLADNPEYRRNAIAIAEKAHNVLEL